MKESSDFQIGYSIISLLAAHRSLTTSKIRELGLYPRQDLILLQLLDYGKQSQNELVQGLCVDHSTVAKSVSRLAKNDLVETSKSAEDKRITLVNLTAKGLEVSKNVKKIWDEVESTAAQNMSSEDVATFVKVAKQMEKNFAAADNK